MSTNATPWLFLTAVSLLLVIALIMLWRTGRDTDDTEAANTELREEVRRLRADVARAEHRTARAERERDAARATVRDLLAARAAGYRWPPPPPAPPAPPPAPPLRERLRPGPLPMPRDVDAALTEEFTQIVERLRPPEAPPT